MNAQTKIEPETLASAMALAFAEIEGATKSAQGQVGQQKYKYADLTGVIEAIKPALSAHGLFFTQHPSPSESGVTITTFLHHAGGESLELGTLFVPANRNDAQGFGSALTYARRYALVTAFGVPVEDDDGNAATKSAPANDAPPIKPSVAHSALKTALRGFVHEMEGCGSWDDWCELRDSPEKMKLIEEVKTKLPEWWETGIGMPEEFVPLRRRIEVLEANFANQIADVARV